MIERDVVRHSGAVAGRARLDATGGRGVGFVDMLSSEWGVIVDDSGKTVWFAVDLDDPSPLY